MSSIETFTRWKCAGCPKTVEIPVDPKKKTQDTPGWYGIGSKLLHGEENLELFLCTNDEAHMTAAFEVLQEFFDEQETLVAQKVPQSVLAADKPS